MLWLPKQVLQRGEGYGRQDLMDSAPKIYPRVGREGPDVKGISEMPGSRMRGSSLTWRKTMWQLCASVSLLLDRIWSTYLTFQGRKEG